MDTERVSALDVATDAVAKQWDDYMDPGEARQVASAVLADLAAAGFYVVRDGDLFANPPTRPTQTVETGGVT